MTPDPTTDALVDAVRALVAHWHDWAQDGDRYDGDQIDLWHAKACDLEDRVETCLQDYDIAHGRVAHG